MFRSVSSIVMPPARTGRERSRRIAVIQTAMVNRVTGDSRLTWEPSVFLVKETYCCAFSPVTIKLRAPRIEEIPAR